MVSMGRTYVSVVIPVRNGEATIEAAVRSALAQEMDGELEVVVADGASSDTTREVVNAIAAVDPRVRLVGNPVGTTPAGLNAAIAASRGDVVIRCDAHAELPPGYVARAVALLEQTGAANVGGMQDARGDTLFGRVVALAQTTALGVGDARYRRGGEPGPVDTVYLGAFRRDALEHVGLYDETLLRNQDYDLNWRLRRAGGVVYFHPDLAVSYLARGSPAGLWVQYFEYGLWKRRMLARHPRSLRWRQLAAPLLVVALTAALIVAFTPLGIVADVLIAAYAGLLVGGSLVVGLSRRDPAALLLPAVLAIMHVAWGAGFWWSFLSRR